MEFVSSERDGAVAVVTIDHPPVNALSAALLEELEEEIAGLDADEEVRAIVLRGGGERAFVAGADISEFPALREAASQEGGSAHGIQRLGAHMDAADTSFVAAIQGFCLGGGLELAMCCDIRVAAEDAQLGQPEIKLGLIPGGGGTQRLPRLVGESCRVRRFSTRLSKSPARSPSARRTRCRCCGSSPAHAVTCLSRKGSDARQMGSAAASRARTDSRA